jgi:hypothetical protein
MKQPWEQQPDEGDRAFAAARLYFEMGKTRSLRAAAEKLDKSYTIVGRWSEKYHWVARARAFDAYLHDLEMQMMETEVKDRAKKWADRREKLLEREWETAEKLLERADAMMKFPLARQTTSDDGKTIIVEPARWNVATALKTLDLASRLGRLAVGEVTERTSASNTVTVESKSEMNFSKFTDDELETFLDLVAKGTGFDPRL